MPAAAGYPYQTTINAALEENLFVLAILKPAGADQKGQPPPKRGSARAVPKTLFKVL